MKRQYREKTGHTVTLYRGGTLRIGPELLSETMLNAGELRFRVDLRGDRLILTPAAGERGGVKAFFSNPHARSPLLPLASSLRILGYDWKEIGGGTYPAVRRGNSIVVTFPSLKSTVEEKGTAAL